MALLNVLGASGESAQPGMASMMRELFLDGAVDTQASAEGVAMKLLSFIRPQLAWIRKNILRQRLYDGSAPNRCPR